MPDGPTRELASASAGTGTGSGVGQIAHIADRVGATSEPDGVGEHPLGDPGAQHPFGDHVDVALEEIAQIHHESTEVEQIPIEFEIDEEVDIACFGALAAGDGAEQAPSIRPSTA